MKLSVPVANVPSASQMSGANWRKPVGEVAFDGVINGDMLGSVLI